MPKQICYNCGVELEDMDVTREHIPAKNLFEGYDEKYKVNRITIPACSFCNGQYSPTDEEFRNMIGIITRNKDNKTITEKSVRSIIRKDPTKQRLELDGFGKVSGVTFNDTPIENYHKKNFKGLFYYQYNQLLTDDYDLHVNIDENDWSEITLGILGYLKDLFTFKYSGHPHILRYIIQPFRLGFSNAEKSDLQPVLNENIYAGLLVYNNEHAALVLATRKEWLEEIKKRSKVN